ncbi:MAG TPA: hypothetical protein VF302_02265 [Candidatus Limnocylindrales bacterium]
MAEILTESFCERCGSRYTFESTTGRRRGLGRIRTLSRGVKNFVANDDTSFTDAMALAREDDSRKASLQQLDAFHKTFNFCMTCRQYTCRNCWNSAVGECLTCAPDLSLEVLPAAFPDLALVGPEAVVASPEAPAPNVAASAWPSSDVWAVAGIPSDTEALAAEAEAEAARQLAAEQAAEAEAEIELTPTELATIEGALHRRIADFDRSATIGAAPASLRQAPDGIETVAETPDAAIAPAPSEAVSTSQLEPVTAAKAETRRFFQWFRVRRSRRALPAPSVPVASLDDTTAITPIEPAGTLFAEPKTPPPEPIEVEVAAMTPKPEPTLLAVESADIAEAAPEPEPVEIEVAAAAAAPEPEPVEAVAAAPQPEPVEIEIAAAAAAPEPEPVETEVAAAPEPELEPVQVAAAATEPEPVAIVSAVMAETAPEPEPEPVGTEVAAAPEAEPAPVQIAAAAPAPEPEPVEEVAAVAPEPELVAIDVAAAAAPEPEPEPAPEPEREPAPVDVVKQPMWRMVAPDGTAAGEAEPAPPIWATPTSVTRRPADAMPTAAWASRVATARPVESPVWAASSRDILAAGTGTAAPVGIHSCVSCGLSLSANARFCRRCGTRQG